MCFSVKSCILAALTALLLTGCSSTFRSYSDTLAYVFFSGAGVDLSLAEVQKLPQPGLYVTVDDRPRALLVRLPSSPDEQKWVSFDRAVIQLQQGRLVQSAGFPQDLQYRKVMGKDYLSLPLDRIKPGMRFEVIQDFQGAGVQNMPSVFQVLRVEAATLELWQQAIPVRVVYEQVEFYDGSTFVNEFWYAELDGQLVRSKQKIAPFWQVFDMQHISQLAQHPGVQP